MSVQFRLPLELVIECYRLLFPPFYFDVGQAICKPPWEDIRGIASASKRSRELILGLWFYVLHITSLSDWDEVLRDWRRVFQWTRVIWYSGTAHQTPKKLLAPFTFLHSARLDLPPTYVTSVGECYFGGPEIEQVLDKSIPGDVIEHLEIKGITWLDYHVMTCLASRFPNLRTLKFKQPLVWCGVCNTIDAPSFKVVPGSIVYEDGKGLPATYSRCLAPLPHLHTVRITVACSVGDISYEDLFITKGVGQRVPPLVSFYNTQGELFSSIQEPSESETDFKYKLTGWSGECDSCMAQLYSDDILRESWLKRRENDVSQDPSSSILHPPSLKLIQWELLDLTAQNWPELLPVFKDEEV